MYNDISFVKKYLEETANRDGLLLVNILRTYLPVGMSVLEIGMGPSQDLDLLKIDYVATGSDNSDPFLDLYFRKHPNADIIKLDARTLETERRFCCVYSNKVLSHLNSEELNLSLYNQKYVLEGPKYAMHSFWLGDNDVDQTNGVLTYKWEKSRLLDMLNKKFTVIEEIIYDEIDTEDSIFVILQD